MRATLISLALLFCAAVASHAGGPAFVAGSGYNSGVEGQPLLWANGAVQYFTDQGDLSPILPAAQADALLPPCLQPGPVFQAWRSPRHPADTSPKTLTAATSQPMGRERSLLRPTLRPSATNAPVGIVYDYDGTVTDALLGEGAGSAGRLLYQRCVRRAGQFFERGKHGARPRGHQRRVRGHQTTQLPDVQYRLVRVLGRILGLGGHRRTSTC